MPCSHNGYRNKGQGTGPVRRELTTVRVRRCVVAVHAARQCDECQKRSSCQSLLVWTEERRDAALSQDKRGEGQMSAFPWARGAHRTAPRSGFFRGTGIMASRGRRSGLGSPEGRQAGASRALSVPRLLRRLSWGPLRRLGRSPLGARSSVRRRGSRLRLAAGLSWKFRLQPRFAKLNARRSLSVLSVRESGVSDPRAALTDTRCSLAAQFVAPPCGPWATFSQMKRAFDQPRPLQLRSDCLLGRTACRLRASWRPRGGLVLVPFPAIHLRPTAPSRPSPPSPVHCPRHRRSSSRRCCSSSSRPGGPLSCANRTGSARQRRRRCRPRH